MSLSGSKFHLIIQRTGKLQFMNFIFSIKLASLKLNFIISRFLKFWSCISTSSKVSHILNIPDKLYISQRSKPLISKSYSLIQLSNISLTLPAGIQHPLDSLNLASLKLAQPKKAHSKSTKLYPLSTLIQLKST